MSDNKYDIAVIGGGPGGYVAAIRASQLGAKVLLVEKDQLGGVCLNRGCIPTKAIIACVNLYNKMHQANKFGISADNIKIDLAFVIERKNRLVSRLVRGVEYLLKENKVDVIKGEGSPETVDAKKIILATGASPISLPGIQFDHKNFLTSDDILDNTEVYEKLDIVGGGVIGVHFAAIYSSLGTKVTIYEALPEILPSLDKDLVDAVKTLLRRKSVEIKTNMRFDPSQSCGKTLICVGRKPNSTNKVNDYLETDKPGVYAIGDLLGQKMLAHVASEQGVIAAENAMGAKRKFSYDNIPITLYTHPEVGSVGLSEQEAKDSIVSKFPLSALGYANALGETDGFIKIIADKKSKKMLGVHIFGAGAADLIGIGTLAVKNGMTAEQLANTIQAHPSMPEGIQEAALHLI